MISRDMHDFKDLKVFQDSYLLGKDIWHDFKKNQNHRLKNQIFGSVTSIPANLAEMAAFDTIPQ